MRLLLINSEYPPVGGGAGNASANIARVLVQQGHEVTLLTSRFARFPHDEVREGVRVVRIPALRRRADRSMVLEQLSFLLSGWLWSANILRRDRPEGTLAFFGIPSGAVAWLLKFLYRIPYVVSLRGGDVPGFRPYDFRLYHKLMSPALRIVWRGASAVVANSSGLRDLARAFDAHVDIPVIPNGVDLEQFIPARREWSPPRILSVGRVVYQKGLDLGLRALAGLQDLPWEWRIAGDGPQMVTLQHLAADLGLRERVRFLGWQEAAQLKEQYAAANLFLFPSRHEGMPNAVLEAMASGLPVVATRIAGSEELVMDGETGALVPTENVQALREALRPLLARQAMRAQMGEAGRGRVEKSFSWTRVAQRYQELLEKAIR
jgi:glycosyltransferase involved in cell wall biosynthesis